MLQRLLKKRKDLVIASIALLLIAFSLRIFKIGQLDLWRDEAFTVLLAQKDLPELIKITVNDANAPLLQLILYFWIKLFGASEVSVRLPSLIFSLAGFGYLFLIAKKYFKDIGVASILLLYAVNVTSIFYAREARAYSLLTFLLLGSFYHLTNLKDSFNKKDAILWILTSALSFYSHNLAIFFLTAEALYCLNTFKGLIKRKAKSDRRSAIKNWLITGITLFTLILPWLIAFIGQAQRVQEGFWLTFDPVNSLTESFTGLATGIRLFSGVTFSPFDAVLNWATIGFLLIGTSYELLNRKKQSVMFSYFFYIPLAIMYFYSFSRPLLYVRYISFLSPLMIILVYKGIKELLVKHNAMAIAIALISILSTNVYFQYYISRRDSKAHYHDMVRFIKLNSKENDGLIHSGALTIFPYKYYAQREDLNFEVSGTYDPNDETPFYTGKAMMTEDDFIRSLSEIENSDRLWIIRLGDNEVNSEIGSKFLQREEHKFDGGLTLELWERVNYKP